HVIPAKAGIQGLRLHVGESKRRGAGPLAPTELRAYLPPRDLHRVTPTRSRFDVSRPQRVGMGLVRTERSGLTAGPSGWRQLACRGEARPSFRRPSMATEIGSPPIHGPLPRFPLAAEPPHQDLTAPPLRRATRSKATRHPCESRDPERSRAIPAFAGMTERAGMTARASTSMAVAMTLAGPARSGLDGTLSIRGIALHPPWKGRDGLRAG